MRRFAFLMMVGFTLFEGSTVAESVTFRVSDPTGAAARIGAPVACQVDLSTLFDEKAKPERLRLGEATPVSFRKNFPIPVQFEPDEPGGTQGTLWWLMPTTGFKPGVVTLDIGDDDAPPALAVETDEDRQSFKVRQGDLPVLVYRHGSVPVPEGTHPHFAEGESYERGDYIHPLFGPDGETMTDDYPADHPHHRGVWWSWPLTRYGDQIADIWAVVGVWARPVAVRRVEVGPVMALIEVENVWEFGKEKKPVVREEVLIRAFRQTGRSRFVDVEVRLTALADDVAIGGRPKRGYGGFSLRAAVCEERKITPHTDPEGTEPRRSWVDYSGVFPGGRGPAGATIFEHVANPDYPNPLHEYPGCNCVMPAYPDVREVVLSKEKPLVLQHRLWIHAGAADEKKLADAWAAYAMPPQVAAAK